jgi:hypothetical protein
MLKRILAGAVVASAILCAAGSAHAAEPCGVVKLASGVARVERGNQVIPVTVGLTLEANDRVVTNSASSVGITLRDDTLVSVGPRSSLLIENFTFNQTTHEGSLAIRVATGAMRMISGLIARQSPGSLRVRTPNATIGIRGTDFIVEVPDND